MTGESLGDKAVRGLAFALDIGTSAGRVVSESDKGFADLLPQKDFAIGPETDGDYASKDTDYSGITRREK